ncbi:MAG: hypothetical protein J6A98_03040 [Clostridia bacterium]|nr:hypothetical protein [Clostridia bacterium]
MKKIKEGTIEADLREWLDIDVAELSEEELIAKNAKLDAFEKRVGYGVNCVFVKNVMNKYLQVVKAKTHFLFHYLGKEIYKDKCLPANQYIDVDNLEKKDFLISRDNIKSIILDKGSVMYGFRKLTFKLKKGGNKSFILYEEINEFNYKNFFGETFSIKNKDKDFLDQMLNEEGVYDSYDATLIKYDNVTNDINAELSLEEKLKSEKIGEMLKQKDEFKEKIGYGKKTVFVKTLSKEFVQVFKTKTHFVFHYLGKEMDSNKCFYSNKDFDISNLEGKDFVIKHTNIEKISLRLKYGKHGKLKFKLKQGRSKQFYHDLTYGRFDEEEFYGKQYKICNNAFLDGLGDVLAGIGHGGIDLDF